MARVRQKFDPSEITDPAAGIRGEPVSYTHLLPFSPDTVPEHSILFHSPVPILPPSLTGVTGTDIDVYKRQDY